MTTRQKKLHALRLAAHNLLVVASSAGTLLWPTAAHAHIVVRVRGMVQVDASINAPPGETDLVVQGRLTDDVGQSLQNTPIRFELSNPETPRLEESQIRTCRGQRDPLSERSGQAIRTDSRGRFCARLSSAKSGPGDFIHVVFDGDDLHGSATAKLSVADRREMLQLELEQLPPVVSLDGGELSFAINLQTLPRNIASAQPDLPMGLRLRSNESGKVEDWQLSQLHVRPGMKTPVAVPVGKLGRPGHAELIVDFEGDATYRPIRVRQKIERTATVKLSMADWPNTAVAGSRITRRVQAMSAVLQRPTGFVELIDLEGHREHFSLRADGSADVTLRVPRRSGSGTVTLRYLPGASGWQSQHPLDLQMAVIPPSQWALLGWVAAAVLVVTWFAWSRRMTRPEPPQQSPVQISRPRACVEILDSAEDAEGGWRGEVRDAHDGRAVHGATVEVRRVGFAGAEIRSSTTTDQAGRFYVRAQPDRGKAQEQIAVRAIGYARLEAQLPPPGRIVLNVVAVRRAILDRLVQWASSRGYPFESKREPTPDWVAEVARAHGYPEIISWAMAVSAGAFGQEPPVQADRHDLLPPPLAGGRPDAKRRD